MNIHMAQRWTEIVVQRSFLKEHSFRIRVYVIYFLTWTETSEVAMVLEAIALPTWPCKQITNM